MIKVIRGGSGAPSARAGSTFTGEVWRDAVMPQSDGVSVGKNFFSPCARTYWHHHPGGQLLIVLAGEGFVADADGAHQVTAGDTIWTPPGVRHWHGATATRYLLHTAITVGGVEWQEPVSDNEFDAAHATRA
ncbi:cupin domain-containing protein [Streptomyces sp. NPDC001027]|uniref:cupin domain-containing protein n=1 Tax=Streptomyces sp. NPDC001027 TaxID=3154771 RepID=UPI003318F0B6